jgi:succinoglycan biosynthesis transport protein ExoP
MAESLDIFRYISYLRLRWIWIAGSCLVAIALALAVSLALPREYTATARIVIEPPAGGDPRSAVALSPIYLESLKTYEQFAAGDSLFQHAVDRFHLRASQGRSIESLKKHVLKVALVRNTRILEIAATLPDARLAQQLAKFLAESTVDLSRALITEGDRDLLQGIGQQEREIRANLDGIETAWARLLSEEPVDDLQSAMSQAAELSATLEQQILNTQLEIADATERQKTAGAAEQAEARKESSNAAARLEEMRKQLQSLDAQARQRQKVLALRLTHRDKVEADRKAGEVALAGIETRLREARAESGYRGERLRIIDPGVVPERPSSPNLPLNVMAALLLGLVLPVLYLMLELNYQERSVSARRSVYQSGSPGSR